MKTRAPTSSQPRAINWLIGGFGLLFLSLSLLLLVNDWDSFRRQPSTFSAGSTAAGIPVGGLDPASATARLNEVYSLPIELRYQGARLQILPTELGFSLDPTATLNQLNQAGSGASWWAHLWGKQSSTPMSVPLRASVDRAVLREKLVNTLANRYDQPASAAMPIIDSTNFIPGQPGLTLTSVDASVDQIASALLSPSERVIELSLTETPALPVDWRNLEVMLKQTIQLQGLSGLAEIYLHDLKNNQTVLVAVQNGVDITPDVAYSAGSTIKIPILVSVLRRLEEPLPGQALTWMRQMMDESLNPPADGLMKAYLDNTSGPLIVSADLKELGYQNTFLAGFFEPGSPLLQLFSTTANSRTDIYLDPDTYNQTVPSEIGDLLQRIYRCAKLPGAENTLFNGEVTASECQLILDLLGNNHIGSLIEAGLPPKAKIGHKHGWTVETDGLLHTISDAGIVYSDGGDYVLVIFVHSPQQILFDDGNRLFAKLSQCIYNSFNLNEQAAWLAN